MTHNEDDSAISISVQPVLERGLDGLPECVAAMIECAMIIERQNALGAAPYERTESRRGHANGFKPRTLDTRIGPLQLQVPQVRGDVEFFPSSLERGQRSEKALSLAVAEMYINGVSTRKVRKVMEKLCGLDVTSSQVSEAAKKLDHELEKWRSRPLGCVKAAIFDAMYEKVRLNGSVVSAAVLVATGIYEDGRRSVLGVSVAISEAEVHWRTFLTDLKSRGLHGLAITVSDDHPGLKAALTATFPGVRWQRCQTHLQRNASSYVTKQELRKPVATDLRNVFNAPDRIEANRLLEAAVKKWEKSQPKLASWMEENVPEGLSVLDLPESCRKRLRTSNMAEGLNRQIRRRTRVATLFPNEASLLRLVSAVLMEVSEEWEAGKVYLNVKEIL